MSASTYDIHQQQLKSGKDNTLNILPLITILGGIDSILTDYLSKNVIKDLNDDQLKQMNAIISMKSKPRPQNKFNRHKTKTILSDTINTNTSRNYNEEEFCYSFYENDTFLHQSKFYKNNKNVLDYVITIYDNKLYLFLIGFTILLYNILNRFNCCDLGTIPHIIYSLIFTALIWTPFVIYKIFAVNKIALKLIVKGFEFWFKIFVAICHFISIWIDYYLLQLSEWKYPQLSITERIIFGISFILVVALISLVDGIRMTRFAKVILISLLAIFCSFYSIKSMILFSNGSQEDDYINYHIIQIGPNIAISLASIQISTMSILSIFLCRQAVLTYLRKESNGKIEGILLYKTPYIIWNVEKQNDTKLEMIKTHSNNEIISKQNLKILHDRQLKNGINNNFYTKRIVDIFGGIDNILSDYLNKENIEIDLSDSQLQELYEIIKPKLLSKRETTKTLTTINQIKKEDINDINIYYFFDEKDTFLHYLINKLIADKLINLFWSNSIKILLLCGIICYIISLIMIEMRYNKIYQIFNILIGIIIFVPYSIMFILSCNKQAFLFAFTSFEFWLETGYGILYVFSSAIDELYLNPNNYTDFGISIELAIIEYISFSIWIILTIMCIAALDSIKLHKYWKVGILLLCTILGIIWTCYLWFIATANEERRNNSILFITNGFSISLLSFEISGVRVLTIFIAQQLFWCIMQNNQAVFILYTPYIQWYKNKNEDNNITEINDELNLAQHVETQIVTNVPKKITTDDVLNDIMENVLNE